MRTKKRFFLKAAGISPTKAVGISLAFVLAFAMAFAACDTGTSNGGSRSPDTGTDPDYAVPVNRTFKNGNVELAITESGGVIYYKLKVAGTQVSYGTATAGTTAWSFSSYAGKSFSIPVSGSGESLAFGAATITADDGTEIPIPALTLAVGTEEKGSGGPPVITVTSEQRLRNDLNTKEGEVYKPGVYRIVSSFALTSDLVVHANQHIVVGGSAVDGEIGQYSAGGPLFTMTGSSKTFNIKAKLTLEDGATLTIAGGAAVNATGGGELYVSGGAKVGVGVDVTEEEGVNIGTGLSALCVDGGSLYVESGATLAVTNNPTVSVDNPLASKVKLEDTDDSAITIETGVTLAIELTAELEDEADAAAVAATVIGGSGATVVIEIPSGAPAAIGAVTVTATGDGAADIESGIGDAVNDALEEATEESPAKTTATAALAKTIVEDTTGTYKDVTSVTYSGPSALGSITIPANKTLIISGAVINQADAIGGTGTLQITGSVETASTGIDQAKLQSLVKASGGGKVVLNSNVTVSGEFDVNLTLEIAEGAKLTLSADEQINGTGTIVNHGTISTAKTGIVNAMLVDNLKQFGGTFELTAAQISVTASDPLTIPANTTLKLSGTAALTVETGATLTVASGASITGADSPEIVVEGTGRINGAGATNFYYNDEETPIAGTIPAGTYTWATDADGEGTPGWKSDADAPGETGTPGDTPATVRNTSTASEVEWDSDTNIVTINYSGTGALNGHTVPDGKALIITSEAIIANQAEAINKTGTGTITNNGTINTGTGDIGADIFANLVGLEGSGKVVLKGRVTAAVDITLTQNLEIAASTGVLTLGAHTISPTTKITKNDGMIKTTTGTEETLRNLVGLAGEGEVEWDNNGTITLTDDALELTTQDLTIGANATLDLVSLALTTSGTGSITNNGTIKTAATTKAALEAILAFHGTIEIGDFTVVGADAAETLTVPAGTKLTVPNNVTLTLGSGDYAGTLNLTDPSSKLVLKEGGKVSAANTGSTIIKVSSSEAGVTVSATTTADAPTGVKDTDSNNEDTVWVLTVDASPESATVIIGKFKLVTGSSPLTDIAGDTDGGAAGSLEAGTGTTITFAGKNEV